MWCSTLEFGRPWPQWWLQVERSAPLACPQGSWPLAIAGWSIEAFVVFQQAVKREREKRRRSNSRPACKVEAGGDLPGHWPFRRLPRLPSEAPRALPCCSWPAPPSSQPLRGTCSKSEGKKSTRTQNENRVVSSVPLST